MKANRKALQYLNCSRRALHEDASDGWIEVTEPKAGGHAERELVIKIELTSERRSSCDEEGVSKNWLAGKLRLEALGDRDIGRVGEQMPESHSVEERVGVGGGVSRVCIVRKHADGQATSEPLEEEAVEEDLESWRPGSN